MPEKYYTEYYKELGTTMEEYISNLASLTLQEKEKKKDKKRIYNIVVSIENGKIYIVEMEEGQEDIKEVFYTDKNNFFGLFHVSLMAEDLKVKGYIIFNYGEMYEGTFKPYFKGTKHMNELKDKMIKILKNNLLAKGKNKNDKNKK